jgi:hypothetical protein
MGLENPSHLPPQTQDDIDTTTDQRTLHDAELLRHGARHKNGVLQPKGEQLEQLHSEMEHSQFEGSEEHNVIETAISHYESILRALEIQRSLSHVPLTKAKVTAEEAERTIEEAVRYLDILPHAQDRAALRQYATDMWQRLVQVSEVLASNTSLRIGSSVNIRRSNGEIEPGWVIKAITTVGDFVLHDSKGQLEKKAPVLDLAEIN